MASEPIHRPMIPLAVALMGGIAAGAWIPGHPIPVVMLAVAALAGVVRTIAVDRSQFVAPLILIVSLGYLCLQPWVAPRFSIRHAVRFVEKGPVALVGRVLDLPRVAAGRQKFQMLLGGDGSGDASGPQCGKIRVTVLGVAPAFARGDTLRFAARLRAPRNFHNPGGFDYRRHLFLQGVRATAYVTAERVERIGETPAALTASALERFRRDIGVLLDRALDGDRAAVLAALTIGDRSRIRDDLRIAFNRVGVGHLLAISGLHVGIVSALVYALLFRGLAGIGFFLNRAWTRKAASLGTAGAVWGYALLAGLSPSTQRAALMISAFLAATLIERERDLPNTLALAALIIVIVHPPALFSISFQLSFAAVAWILIGVRPNTPSDPVADAPPGWSGRPRAWARQFFFVSLWAILGTLPLVMQTFNRVSLVGLPANFFFVPLIGMLVVPVGLGATALALISTPAALWGFRIAGALLEPTLGVLRFLADLPLAAVPTFTPRPEEIVLYYGALALGLSEWRRPVAPRLSRWKMGLCTLVLIALCADGVYWGYRRFWHTDLRATVLDVGQGTATVLELPGGAVVLVDGGGFSSNAIFDVGQRLVAPFLRYQKIGRIDLVVLSHANADHLNGLLYVMDNFPVGAVWSNHEAADTLGYRQFVETIGRRQLPWPSFEALPRRSDFGRSRIELLHPKADFGCLASSPPWRNANNNSLVLKVCTDHGAILLTGDIEGAAEQELVGRAATTLFADVLVVPHHGSRTSSSAVLLDAVHAREAIITCGWQNRYHMPHPSVLDRLKAGSTRVWRTDHNGALRVTIDSGGVKVVPFLAGAEGL